MDESPDPNKPQPGPPAPDVDQLLKMLSAQTAARRERRLPAPRALQTPSFRYGVLIAIVVFTFGSLGLLDWLLSEIPRPAHPAGTAPASIAPPAAKTGTMPEGEPPHNN